MESKEKPGILSVIAGIQQKVYRFAKESNGKI
jgi:hypothetical protein